MSINNKKLITLISNVLDIDVNLITDDTSPENTESWDSFNALVMVSELESEFDVHFSMEEVYSVTCVQDIREALVRHDVDFK
jgi:acyl carrier protein